MTQSYMYTTGGGDLFLGKRGESIGQIPHPLRHIFRNAIFNLSKEILFFVSEIEDTEYKSTACFGGSWFQIKFRDSVRQRFNRKRCW